MQTVTILTRDTGMIVGHRIERADSSLSRLVGLLGRRALNTGEGIWLHPSSGVHTFGMRFAIDVVGLDREMRVVKLWPGVKPQRITSLNSKVRSVLELAAGEIGVRSIQIGQTLYAVPRKIDSV